MSPADLASTYARDGYASGVRIISETEAAEHRAALEQAEANQGPLHYKAKMHTVMSSPLALATHPRVLDAVEALIGPDILLYDAGYIIKEPHTDSHVSWHQDMTFWGLDDDAQVSLWLALSPATEESGCMRMVPGSHTTGIYAHRTTDDKANVLLQGQTVDGVAEAEAVMCPLAPGEASFHHGWVLHASMPNRSDDRRIGLNAQFIAPHVRQTKHDMDTAMLVRGEDRFGHFGHDVPATGDFESGALQRWHELNDLHVATQGTT
jgi:ectoine hydroxylase-related dioxygenase (phytanoyl-CoA dioxygenase family)